MNNIGQTNTTSTTKKRSVENIRSSIEKFENINSLFAAKRDFLKLLELTKNDTRTFTIFSREKLRTYLKNPKQNEDNLRNLARYLKRYSMQFNRLINYFSNMIDLKANYVIPHQDFTQDLDPETTLVRYYKTLKKNEQMSLDQEIFKLLTVLWLEGAAYGYVYDDDESFFIHVLDGSYCKIYSIDRGVYRFAFDFSYFKNKTELLEFWAPEFQKKYSLYEKDTSKRWQELDQDFSICLKLDPEDPTMSLPPFLPMFENIISLVDLQAIQDAKDALSAYKLLVAEMETSSNTNESDNFTVDPDTALAYFDRLSDSLPPQVAAVISPLKLTPIEFRGTTTEDEDSLSKSMSNLFKASGGSQVLSSDKSGSTIFEAQILADTEFAISAVLPQIEKWHNMYLARTVGDDHAKVKYMEISSQTRDKHRKSLIESGQNGVPVKLAVAALNGLSPLDTLSLDYLENSVLKLHETWVPFSTSYTKSSAEESTGGAPKKDADELTDEGSATREDGKNGM